MKTMRFRNVAAWLLAIASILSTISGVALAVSNTTEEGFVLSTLNQNIITTNKSNYKQPLEQAESQYDDDDIVRVMVTLEDEPVLKSSGTVRVDSNGVRSLTDKGQTLANKLAIKQDNAIESISSVCNMELSAVNTFTLLFNGFSVDIPYGMIDSVSKLSGVASAQLMPTFDIPETRFESTVGTSQYSSGEMIGSDEAWATGYDGSGSLVGVVDTGLYTEHEAFMTAPTEAKYDKDDIARILEENDLHAKTLIDGELTAEDLYLREKVPYVFDYVGKDTNVNHGGSKNSDHGTHVAGIAVGNPTMDIEGLEGNRARGTAVNAQLAVFKVYGDDGKGANWDTIIGAVEDAMLIGCDVINLSLGNAKNFPEQEEAYAQIYTILDDNGVSLSVASGNDDNSGYNNTWGNMNTTENVDNSILSEPACYEASFAVAAIDNKNRVLTNYVEVGGRGIYFVDSAVTAGDKPEMLMMNALGGKTYELVSVPGYGLEEDYAGLDVEGKICVISRGNGSFADKEAVAYNHGAAGCIIHDNKDQTVMTEMSVKDPVIPAVFVKLRDGMFIRECIENGDTSVYVTDGSPKIFESDTAAVPSQFSSWGPVCNLQLKPEIAAPGGDIISTVDPSYSGGVLYGEKSGTSMAAPNVAGSLAIVRQFIRENFEGLSAKEQVDLASSILMSTANPTVDKNGVEYSVRKQGAGMVNVANAVKAGAYLRVDGVERAKIELGDDPTRSGEYTLRFNVVNYSDEAKSYKISPSVLTAGYKLVEQETRKTTVMTLESTDLTDMCDYTTNYDNNIVTVGAGETKAIEVVITLKDEARSLISEVFPFGTFIEGYCYLERTNSTEGRLNMVYLGFYGDWSEVPVIDGGFYYDKPEDDLSMMQYPNTAASKYNSNTMYEIGMNPYIESEDFEFLADRGSMSPANKDKYFDSVSEVYTGIMRNLSTLSYVIYDKDSGEVYWERALNTNIMKDTDVAYLNWGSGKRRGYIPPTGTVFNAIRAFRGDGVEEGRTVMVKTLGIPYMSGEFNAEVAQRYYWEFPVTVDNTAPQVVEQWSEGDKLFVKITDNHYAAYAAVYDINDTETPIAEYAIAEDERGAETIIEIDMTERESAYLVLGDYACNESQIEIKRGTNPTPPTTEDEGVKYERVSELTAGDSYIIAAKNGDEFYAMTGTSAVPYGVRLQGAVVNVSNETTIDGGERYSGIEWSYDGNGGLKNKLSGEYLGLVNKNNSYWLGTTEGFETSWSFNGGELTHNDDRCNLKTVAYAQTIAANDSFAFDVTESGNGIMAFKRIDSEKTSDVILSSRAEYDGDKIKLTISLDSGSDVMTGMIGVAYNPEYVTLEGSKCGSLLERALIQENTDVSGRVVIAFSTSEPIELTGNMYELTFGVKATEGTLVFFDVYADEFTGIDNTDMSSSATGTAITAEGENPTPPETPDVTPSPGESTPPNTPTPTGNPSPNPPGTGSMDNPTAATLLLIGGLCGIGWFVLSGKKLLLGA